MVGCPVATKSSISLADFRATSQLGFISNVVALNAENKYGADICCLEFVKEGHVPLKAWGLVSILWSRSSDHNSG